MKREAFIRRSGMTRVRRSTDEHLQHNTLCTFKIHDDHLPRVPSGLYDIWMWCGGEEKDLGQRACSIIVIVITSILSFIEPQISIFQTLYLTGFLGLCVIKFSPDLVAFPEVIYC